jgi:hypothetical protein
VNQQDHGSSEMRVAEAAASDQQLPNRQIFGVPEWIGKE